MLCLCASARVHVICWPCWVGLVSNYLQETFLQIVGLSNGLDFFFCTMSDYVMKQLVLLTALLKHQFWILWNPYLLIEHQSLLLIDSQLQCSVIRYAFATSQETIVRFESILHSPDMYLNFTASGDWWMLVWFNLISSILMILVYYFQIIVLENGKVVEQGPHDFLLSKGGRYAELWYQQNNSDAVDSAAVSLEVWLMLYAFPFCKGKRRENTIITERERDGANLSAL